MVSSQSPHTTAQDVLWRETTGSGPGTGREGGARGPQGSTEEWSSVCIPYRPADGPGSRTAEEQTRLKTTGNRQREGSCDVAPQCLSLPLLPFLRPPSLPPLPPSFLCSNLSSLPFILQVLLQPVSSPYTKLAEECVKQGVAVELFLTPPTYCDVATLGGLCSTTGGQLHLFHNYKVCICGDEF